MQAISGFVSLPLDLFKEHLYDELGFDNLEEKQLLDAEARGRYNRGIGMLMQEHKMGSSSSRVDRSFVKHLGLNWSRCFYYAAALLLLALNQTRSRNIRLMKLFQFV